MSVAIDKSGENQLAASIDRLGCSVFGGKVGARTDSHDGVSLYNDGTVVVDGSRAIHGDDRAASDDQVGILRLR